MDWYTTLLLFGAAHAGLFSGLLVLRSYRNSSLADALLAGLLLAQGVLLLPVLLGMLDHHWFWKEGLFFPRNPSLLLGPLVLGYVFATTNPGWKLRYKHLLHGLPFLLFSGYQLSVFLQGKASVHTWIDAVHLPYLAFPLELLALASHALYTALAIRRFRAYRRWVEEEYADPASRRFGGLFLFLLFAVLAFTTNAAFQVFEWVGSDFDFGQNWFRFLALVFLIYYLGLDGWSPRPALVPFEPAAPDAGPRGTPAQTSLPANTSKLHANGDAPVGPRPVASGIQSASEQHSISLDQEERPEEAESQDLQHNALAQRIAALLEDELLYRSPDLSVTELARRVGRNRTEVSHAINQELGVNFNQLVNGYRVRAFLEEAKAPANAGFSLLGIAYSCGFNSKATFNRAFRQETGESPSAYLKRIQHPVR